MSPARPDLCSSGACASAPNDRPLAPQACSTVIGAATTNGSQCLAHTRYSEMAGLLKLR